jgi:hypothetical protein
MLAAQTLPIEAFGRSLITSGDLDPVYIALHGMNLDNQWSDSGQLKRWLLAYWCYYDCGVSCYLSEFKGDDYWRMMMVAAENKSPPTVGKRWPRGKERRHFRGDASVVGVNALTTRYHETGPEGFVDYCAKGKTLQEVTKLVKEHQQFGPWIAFKVADMLERVMSLRISFDSAAVLMFKDPTKAALMAYEVWHPEDKTTPQETRLWAVAQQLGNTFRDLGAPPRYDRCINIQEVETVLCKWKSHCHGHYPVGLDTHEVREGAALWAPVSKTAGHFLSQMPTVVIP